MKVKAISDYNSTALGRLVKKGEVLEVSDARGKILLEAKVAEAVAEEEKPKTRRKKKADE